MGPNSILRILQEQRKELRSTHLKLFVEFTAVPVQHGEVERSEIGVKARRDKQTPVILKSEILL